MKIFDFKSRKKRVNNTSTLYSGNSFALLNISKAIRDFVCLITFNQNFYVIRITPHHVRVWFKYRSIKSS